MPVITREMVESLQTPKGGYAKAPLVELGVAWPLQTGWKLRLIGRTVADEQWDRAEKARWLKAKQESLL